MPYSIFGAVSMSLNNLLFYEINYFDKYDYFDEYTEIRSKLHFEQF